MGKTISAFKITEQMIEDFYKEGYFYAPGLLSQEMVNLLNHEHSSFAEGSGSGEWKSNGFTHFSKHEEQYPETARMLLSPQIVNTLEAILGDAVRLWMGMYAVVPPRGKGLEWHQDNQYTHILGHMLNGFIALDSITQENAGLWLAPSLKELHLDHAESKKLANLYWNTFCNACDFEEHAKDILLQLHGNYRLAIISNGIGEAQRGRLISRQIEHYFDTLVISDEVGYWKPDKEIFMN